MEYMDKRVRFIVEQSSFFKTNILVTEGFVKQENLITLFSEIRKLGKSCLIDSNGLRPIPGRWKSQRA